MTLAINDKKNNVSMSDGEGYKGSDIQCTRTACIYTYTTLLCRKNNEQISKSAIQSRNIKYTEIFKGPFVQLIDTIHTILFVQTCQVMSGPL